MNDLAERIANLSGEKRALLLNRLNQAKAPATPVFRIPSRPRQGVLPLSFAQERLWFMSRLEPESGFYSIFQAIVH